MTGSLATKPRVIDVPQLAEEALWLELELTPKPGLVDKLNNGSHRDMDHGLFVRSITAIAPWFSRFAELGAEHAAKPASEQLRLIRPMGMACEQAMYAATGGINTHKGGIFALGLLCFAAGRVPNENAHTLCCEVSNMCRGLVDRELAGRSGRATAGERQYQDYGLTGARGEAESGFATVRKVLAQWNRQSVHDLLLRLMVVNQDSNLVSRGGMEGLRYVQRYAQHLVAHGWDRAALAEMDNALIARNLSPGGSADLLSVGIVLAECCPAALRLPGLQKLEL
ncbi:triphosphoribosyl-dephospho-CoA synthase CitG [Lelliottia sp. V89_10]|uniref:triphosphoribosyl-dephospho-CoA synthase CitG n=1 Tax=Lelliottia wanjuensis TaxID=3050585 RepID=UPI00249EBCA1|nr:MULTISPECIES: triphosphoribosyl-dephospho-CoA synthase CitG [unclassified Lelliottia]MDI3361906.1 triphosphoribosyl-dephospho-CoA synthase CitG [Lelliottia sp. V89_13]MDK9550635.1 triphosphoribosyl-dephospho-CoA synthase CitG [Lelliottia sp. V89_5]MDK9594629.1 triphosphoribosyl-dephospho-CoA synthase CitG [Lelliottia sp. V89_10]